MLPKKQAAPIEVSIHIVAVQICSASDSYEFYLQAPYDSFEMHQCLPVLI